MIDRGDRIDTLLEKSDDLKTAVSTSPCPTSLPANDLPIRICGKLALRLKRMIELDGFCQVELGGSSVCSMGEVSATGVVVYSRLVFAHV